MSATLALEAKAVCCVSKKQNRNAARPSRFLRFGRSTLGQGLLGAALLWAAFPPLDLWLLAWVAPIPWVLLIRRRQLAGRRPYTMLALAGFSFWMAVLHFLRLPHWATSFGWVALSFYFAFYLPLFVGLSRVAVHRLRVPVILAAPVVWTGLELARAHLLTGMSMASLGHTQYRWIESDPIERPSRGLRRELCGHVRRGGVGDDASRRKGGQAFCLSI